MARLFASQKFRRVTLQGGFIIAVVALITSVILVGQRNIAEQGIATGFGFLEQTTGWPVNFSVIEVTGRSTYARVLWAGLLNTMLVGFLTLFFSTLLGLILALMRVSSNTLMKLVGTAYVEVFRNVPVILQVFFWYAILTHLPSPKKAYSIGEVVFLSNRGLMMPAPAFSDTDLFWITGAVVASGLALYLTRDRPGPGRRWGAAAALITLVSEPGAYRDAATGYFYWLLAALPGFLIAYSANGILQAHGDSVTMQRAMMAAFVANIGLNPLFIYGVPGLVPGLGLDGIALATIVAQTGVMGFVVRAVLRLLVVQGARMSELSPQLASFLDHCDVVVAIHGYGLRGRWIDLLFGGGDGGDADGRDTDLGWLFGDRTDGLDRAAVREQRVVADADHVGLGELEPGRVLTGLVSQQHEALGLIERDPVRDAVGQTVNNDARVVGEPIDNIRIEPAALLLELEREVPVVERDVGGDPGVEQRVDEVAVEVEPGFVDRAGAVGHDAGPGDGQTVGVEPEFLHELDVFAPLFDVHAGGLAVVALEHLTRRVAERVPDVLASRARLAGALDLERRCGGAPDKLRWKSHNQLP